MPQQHLDRLTPVDASFLHQESPVSHMHVGGPAIFAGPAPAFDQFLQQIRGRLHLVPRYRHKLAHTALDSGRPVWIDDPAFEVAHHVRHAVLPAPGGWEQLRQLTARIYSRQLDRSKPLWELWLVEGLEDDRFALVSKSHHALIDGSSGVDIATVLLDITPEPVPAARPSGPWMPHPEPGTISLVTAALRDSVRAGIALPRGAIGAVARPDRTVKQLIEAAAATGEVARMLLTPAPATPLNVEIGPQRRFVGIACRLNEFKTVKRAFGGTVNDVVLAVVTAALRAFLVSRGVPTAGLELRALVPVSTRQEDEHHHLGNRMVLIRAPLPVHISDPVQRLRFIKRAMDDLKQSKQALGAELIAGAQKFAPPMILPLASRLTFSTRLFNVIVTNLPGPPFPLYAMGREMQKAYAVAFLARNHALAINVMSYNGQMNFGLLGDYDALPEIDAIGESIRDELVLLLTRAAAVSAFSSEGQAA